MERVDGEFEFEFALLTPTSATDTKSRKSVRQNTLGDVDVKPPTDRPGVEAAWAVYVCVCACVCVCVWRECRAEWSVVTPVGNSKSCSGYAC